MNVEARLAAGAARKALIVGPVLLGAAALLRGLDGAVAAALALAVVVANFLASGAMLSVAARISPVAYQAAALFGFFLRLGLITIVLLLLLSLWELDRVTLGVTAVVGYLALLSWEAVDASRDPDLAWGEAG